MENKITKINLEDYKTFQSLHIHADKETMGKILEYISILNNKKEFTYSIDNLLSDKSLLQP